MSSLNQQANAITNDVILPGDEVDYRLGSGDALVAMDPSESRQDVASALQNVNEEDPMDRHAIALSRGGSQHIANQAQFNAMSPHQKAVIRAAVSAGGNIKASDGLKFYQDSLKQARAHEGHIVKFPDGTQAKMAGGQVIYDKQPEPDKTHVSYDENKNLKITNLTTGKTFSAWDEQTGDPIRGEAKLSPKQEEGIKNNQLISENLGARLVALTRFAENDKVDLDVNTGTYSDAGYWGGTKVKDARIQLEKEKEEYDKRIEVALRPVRRSNAAESQAPQPAATPSPTPQVTPSPTPRPKPMPTPDKFIVDRTYTDANGNKAIYRGNGVFE